MGFIFALPIIAAIIGFIIFLFAFMGICLIIIGITGVIMNKIYIRQTNTGRGVSKPLCNVSAIIIGIGYVLFPLGFLLFGIIAALST